MKEKIVNEVVKLVPEIYKDLAKPLFQTVGAELGKTGKTVLLPLTIFNEVIDKHVQDFLKKIIAEKNPEDLVIPKRNILLSALQGINYNFDQIEIRELFENLLKSSIDREKSSIIQPKFLEILKQISRDEAIILEYYCQNVHYVNSILKLNIYAENIQIDNSSPNRILKNKVLLFKDFFKGLLLREIEFPENYKLYIENLENLGLIERDDQYNYEPKYSSVQENEVIDFLKNNELVKNAFEKHKKQFEGKSNKSWTHKTSLSIVIGRFRFTEIGRLFCLACINDSERQYDFIYRNSSDFAIEKAIFEKGKFRIGSYKG